MEETGQCSKTHAQHHQRLQHTLPQPHGGADLGVFRQAVIDLRLVGMLQHIHHVGAPDAGRVVQAGIGVSAFLQVDHPLLGMVNHVFLGTEGDGTGRAGLHAGRLEPHRHAIRTQRALVRLAVLLGDARHIEGTTGHAIATTDTVLFNEVNNAVRVLHDGARRRAGLQAARLGTMHAAVLADQPLEVHLLALLLLDFGVPHHRPGLGGEVGRVVVDADVVTDFLADVVPFAAGHLAGLATDAFRHIDQLGHFQRFAGLRRRQGGGRAALDIQTLQ